MLKPHGELLIKASQTTDHKYTAHFTQNCLQTPPVLLLRTHISLLVHTEETRWSSSLSTRLQFRQLACSSFSPTAMSHYISREGEERTSFQVKIVAWKINWDTLPRLHHPSPVLIHKPHSLKWIMLNNKGSQLTQMTWKWSSSPPMFLKAEF